MPAHRLFRVANQLGNLAHRHVRQLQHDANESVPEAVMNGMLFPGATQLPQANELATPQIGQNRGVGIVAGTEYPGPKRRARSWMRS